MSKSNKVYSSDPSKFGKCPKCGHKNGINPFRFGVFSKATNALSAKNIMHHKCKKCLWQGYVLVNSESRTMNYLTHFMFYAFWGVIMLSIPLVIFCVYNFLHS